MKAVERERGRTNQRTRDRFFRRDPLCAGCKRKSPPVTRVWTQLDHIVALINGGTNDDSNREGLCDECTKAKTARDLGQTQRPKQRIGLDGYPVD